MAQIVWSETALLDLDEIAEYIALDNVRVAKNLVRQIFLTVARLAKFPDPDSKPLELERSKYLEVVVIPCRVFYRVDVDHVYILYIMRAEEKLRKYLIDVCSGTIG